MNLHSTVLVRSSYPPTILPAILRLLRCKRGGFIIDAVKGSPAPVNGNPLSPISSQSAMDDYTRLQQAAGLGLGQANTLNAGVGQGVDAQSQLLQQLIAQSQGGGPNPAQAALNNATGANVAQTAALAAGTRGSSANAGAVGRQIAQAGAGIQQQAAGQGAELLANQTLAAQQQLGQLGGQLVGQGLQSTQGALAGAAAPVSALGAQNNANVSNAGQMSGAQASGYGTSAGLFGLLSAPKKAHGGMVDGDAKVAGDSEANDTELAWLSPGEIVVPRSYASDPKAAAAFAHACALFASKNDD